MRSSATSPSEPRVCAPPRTSSIVRAAPESSRPACCTSPSCWRIVPSISVDSASRAATACCASEASVPVAATPVCNCWVTWPSCCVTECASWPMWVATLWACVASNVCISCRNAVTWASLRPRIHAASAQPPSATTTNATATAVRSDIFKVAGSCNTRPAAGASRWVGTQKPRNAHSNANPLPNESFGRERENGAAPGAAPASLLGSLPTQLQAELELPRVERGSGLAGGAGAARPAGDIAQRVHVRNVEAVKQVKHVGDEFEVDSFSEVELAGDANVPLVESGAHKRVASQVASAADRRRNQLRRWNRDGRRRNLHECVAYGGCRKRNAGDKRRGDSAGGDDRRAPGIRAEVEPEVSAGEHGKGPPGGDFNDWSDGEIGQELVPQAAGGARVRALEHGARDPAVALVEGGIAALEIGSTLLLGLEQRLQVGGVVNRMGPGIAGEELEMVAEALREIDR